MSCGVGHRQGSDLALLWLWTRLGATALIHHLSWKPLYAMGVALKKKKTKNKNKYKNGERNKIEDTKENPSLITRQVQSLLL